MKLWVKTALGLGVVGAASGIAIGSMAIFNKTSKSVNGASFENENPMGNGYNISSIRNLKVEDLNSYFVKSIANNNDVFANYLPEKDQVNYNGKLVTFAQFNKAYVRKFNDSPVQVVRFGPATFQNEYLDAVSPKEFAEYVVWFLKNVSWGGDLAALENFSLRRGVKADGSSVILGEHTNKNNEQTTIEFYPDGFFGSLPAYSTEAGRGQQYDNLLVKLSDINNTLLTLDDIQQLIDKKLDIKALANIADFRIRTIVPVQTITDPNDKTRDGQMGYEVYADIYPRLIDDVLEMYPYLAKELDGWHVERDPKLEILPSGSTYHKDKLVNGKYWGIDPSSRIPFLAVLAASNPDFKGVGINWLKYVGQHEYGHHITLQSLQDGSEKGTYAGAVSSLKTLNAGGYYSIEAISKYLQARAKGLDAKATGTEEGTVGEFIRFVEGIDPKKAEEEENKDVYGSIFPSNLTDAIDNERRRAGRVSLTELAKVAQTRGISLQDLIIENAWDLNSASINPGASGDAMVYAIKNGKAQLVTLKETTTQTSNVYGNVVSDDYGTAIEQDTNHGQAILQWWFDENNNKEEPVFYQFNSTQGGKVLGWASPENKNHKKLTRKTILFEDANGNKVPLVADDCSVESLYQKEQEITNFMLTLAWDYSTNGWESENSLSSGIRFDETIYKPATGEDYSDKYSAKTVDGYAKFLNSGKNALFSFLVQSRDGLQQTDVDKNGDYFSPKFKTTGQSTSEQLALMGNSYLKFSRSGYGFGAEKGLGSYFDVDGIQYTSMPSGNFGEWGMSGSRADTAWETLIHQQKVGARQTGGMFILSQKNATTPTMLSSWGVDENGGVVDKLSFFDPTDADFTPDKTKAFMPIDATKDSNNELVMYILEDEYNHATSTVKKTFPDVTLDASFMSSDLKAWTKTGSKAGQMTFANYVKQLSLNPLTDFEFAKSTTNIKTSGEPLDAKGKTIITRQALEKFFDVGAFMTANKLSETEAQTILTLYVMSKNLAFIQEFDKTQANEASLKTNSSLKAYLLQGDSIATAKSSLGFAEETGIRQWYIKEISDTDYETMISELFKAKKNWNVEAPSLKLDESTITFNELSFLTGLRRFSFLNDSDFGIKMTVGPTSDIRTYLQSRSEEKLAEIYSDYSYDIAEMTNRDYIQVTYTPSQEKLANTPGWLKDISEAESGFEYSIDSTSTSQYLSSSMLNAYFGYNGGNTQGLNAISDAIKEAFNFTINKWGEVEAKPDANGKITTPSKGIIAVSNLDNWKNSVRPNFIGKPTAMSNGFFKDDFLRRSVGNEIYTTDGTWKFTLIGDDVYNSIYSRDQKTTPVGKYYSGQESNVRGAVMVDPNGEIIAVNDGLEFVGIKGTIAENWTIDTSSNIVDKTNNGALVGKIDTQQLSNLQTKALEIKDLNGNVIAYIANQVLTTDNKKVDYKVVGKNIYKFNPATDYKNVDVKSKEMQIQGNEIYNTDGTAVTDKQIALKTIYGEEITNRATAVWQWLLQSKGIGDGLVADPVTKVVTKTGRNIEGIWRSPDRDATYAWGYIPNELQQNGQTFKASDIKYLEYKDADTGATNYVPVSIGQNNLYYYNDRKELNQYYEVEDATHQNKISSSISYIENEGFTSWTSDFVSMGGYQDAFLQTGHKYIMALVDENHNEVMKIDLGSREVIAENGKPAGKAPNVIRKNVNGEAIISIQDQFNN